MTEETIELKFAALREVQLRKHFGVLLFGAGGLILVTAISANFELQYPVGILGIMAIMFFYVKNNEETERLAKKYE